MDLMDRRGLMLEKGERTPFKYVLSASVENKIAATPELKSFLDAYIVKDGRLYYFVVKGNKDTGEYACVAGAIRNNQLFAARRGSFTTTVASNYDSRISAGATIDIYEVII